MVWVKDTATAPSEMLVSVLPSVWMAASGRICNSCLPVICYNTTSPRPQPTRAISHQLKPKACACEQRRYWVPAGTAELG